MNNIVKKIILLLKYCLIDQLAIIIINRLNILNTQLQILPKNLLTH